LTKEKKKLSRQSGDLIFQKVHELVTQNNFGSRGKGEVENQETGWKFVYNAHPIKPDGCLYFSWKKNRYFSCRGIIRYLRIRDSFIGHT
jgi:hypothetical protein